MNNNWANSNSEPTYVIIFGVNSFSNEALAKVITILLKSVISENNILPILSDKLSSFQEQKELITTMNSALGTAKRRFICLWEIEKEVRDKANNEKIDLQDVQTFFVELNSTNLSSWWN